MFLFCAVFCNKQCNAAPESALKKHNAKCSNERILSGDKYICICVCAVNKNNAQCRDQCKSLIAFYQAANAILGTSTILQEFSRVLGPLIIAWGGI